MKQNVGKNTQISRLPTKERRMGNTDKSKKGNNILQGVNKGSTSYSPTDFS
jgi:hypothetical protein